MANIQDAKIGSAVATRSGAKAASLTSGLGTPLCYTTPEPLHVTFECQGWQGNEERQNLVLQLDEPATAAFRQMQDELREKASKQLNLDPRDFNPIIKESERGCNVKVKVQRVGHYATKFWTPDRELMPDRPEELQYTRCRVRIHLSSIWVQNRSWGVVLQATDCEVHAGLEQQAQCPF